MALIFRGGGFAPPGGGGGPPGTWTWDPSNKNSHISLSGGNLTAMVDASSVAGAMVLATNSFTTASKVYWEQQYVGVSNFSSCGFCNGASGTADGLGPNSDSNGTAYIVQGQVYVGGTIIVDIGGYTAGSFIGIAVDGPNGNFGFTLDGTTWNGGAGNQTPGNSAWGLSITGNGINAGPYFPSGEFYQENGATWIANFGAAAFNFTLPSGFVKVNTLP